MRLFDIDPDDNTVQLNKVWIMLVPQFAELLRRDKGSVGDYRGEKKLQARRELTFIYFHSDFGSPITDWADSERRKEALVYAGLETIDDKVETADEKFQQLQLEGSTSLRTYRSMLKARAAMDTYFENLNFTEKDKKGELVNDPGKVADTIKKIEGMHTSIANFRKKVETELKDKDTGIRGTAELGDTESSVKARWSEQDVMTHSDATREGSGASSGTFADLNHTIMTSIKKERTFTDEQLREEVRE